MNKTKISLIAAIGKNRELGFKNDLIWKIPEDLKHFKLVTESHSVIMGQKTFESIGKPLPNRRNIILTHDRDFVADGCDVCYSIEEAIESIQGEDEVFFIGGASIYDQSIKLADKLYLTLIDASSQADAFFPEYSDFFKKKKIGEGSFGGLNYEFWEFEK